MGPLIAIVSIALFVVLFVFTINRLGEYETKQKIIIVVIIIKHLPHHLIRVFFRQLNQSTRIMFFYILPKLLIFLFL